MKLAITYLLFSSSLLTANPIAVTIVKEGTKEVIKKAPKIIKAVAPLVPISDLAADEVKEKISKEKLDLLKTDF